MVSRFVGHHTITLDTVRIHNYAEDQKKNTFNCYQFYEEALSLIQFVHTRDACIIYSKYGYVVVRVRCYGKSHCIVLPLTCNDSDKKWPKSFEGAELALN